MMVLCAVAVLGAGFSVTLITPAAGATLTGITAFNATIKTENIVNCTYYIKSASTANSTFAASRLNYSDSFLNNGQYNTSVYQSINSALVEDASNYTVNVSCSIPDNSVNSTTVTNVLISNTVPLSPTSIAQLTTAYAGDTITLQTNVTDSQTTGCDVRWTSDIEPSNTKPTATYHGAGCIISIVDALKGQYEYKVGATDSQSTVYSELVQLAVSGKGIPPPPTPAVQEKAGLSVAGKGIGGIDAGTAVVVLIIIGLAYWLFFSKKHR